MPYNKVKFKDRLHFKIAFFIILTIIIIFGIYSAYQFLLYQSKLTRAEKESSELLAQTLKSSLEIAMLNSNLEAIQYSFQETSKNPHIQRVFLLNKESEIRASSEKDKIGTRMSLSDVGCKECHFPSSQNLTSTRITLDSEEMLRVVIPIKNKKPCFRCHGANYHLNGLLVLDHSLKPTKAELYSSIKRAGIIAGISVLIMMLLFRWYIRKQVINRVAYLESLARRVVNNELDLDIELSGTDELASLAESFNNMKSTLRYSIEKLDNHRNYLNNLLNNLLDGILIIDDNDKVVYVNKSLGDVLEIDSFSIEAGDSVNTFLNLNNSLNKIENLIKHVKDYKTAAKDVIRLQFESEREKYLEVHIAHLLLPPQRKPEIIIVVKDITAIITFEKQMYQSEKLATVGRLAAGIAHEINNPMATILTCAEGLLKNNNDNNDSTKEYLEIITNSAHRCKIITQKLLDYAATDLRKEIVNLEEVINEAVSLLQFEASKKNITLTIKKEKPIPLINGSKDSLVQVFVNLILNSVQAVENNGKIEIIACPDSSHLDIYVNDTGSGINKPILPRIFEPFFTTKPVGEGTGLGLSVSQGIIKQHNGMISIVESRKGLTSVKVSFPITHVKRS